MRAIAIIPTLLAVALTTPTLVAAEQRPGLNPPNAVQVAANLAMNPHRDFPNQTPGYTAEFSLLRTAQPDSCGDPPRDPGAIDAPLIQVALLLDTSNSMDGLINQARSQLWAIVNSLTPLTREGRRPTLQVALYEYGKASIPAAEQHLRQVLPFTTDLDRVSEQLFALTTNGGEEYCGAVVRAASRGLSWSPRATDLKVMIVAGNEPFTQGTTDYRPAVIEAAKGQNIVINTIFCGQRGEGLASGWMDGATLGGGTFGAIDQNRVIVDPPAPQDAELARLGTEINDTYIPYGLAGKEGQARQVAQDTNSSSLSSGSFSNRAASKAGSSYRNDHWDLCDAVTCKTVDLGAVPAADLPAHLRDLTPEQRAAYVAGKLAERRRIQERIQQLTAERAQFIAAHRAANAEAALDDAIIASIRTQAKRIGFVAP
jgi:hypothetical protein